MKIMKKGKRALSFALAILMAGMSFSPSIPAITTFADTDEPIQNPDGTTPNGNKPQDTTDTARLYVNNTPIRLEVSKVKTQVGDHEGISPNNHSIQMEDTITYKLSGRVEGSQTELMQTYGTDQIELAYSDTGTYLGYGWIRGTYEYLSYRSEHADKFGDLSAELMYNEYGVFTGYAYITKKLETADDANRYVAGAKMTLFDAIEIFRAPDYTQDDRFEGVTVERNSNGDVTNVYVQKGYAGTKIEYVKEETDESKITVDENGRTIDDNYTYQDEINDTGDGVWIAKTIQREDTPILYYSLSDLHITTNDRYNTNATENANEIDQVFGNERPDKDRRLYGFDREGNVVDITQREEYDFSIFAFEDGDTEPVFELVGGDFSEIAYDGIAKTITVGEGTIIYHLDEDGNRDAMVDPQTGIAYIEEEIVPPENASSDIHHNNGGTKIYVWPVNIYYDGSGSKTFEKIKTNRIATINADTADEYTIGTYDPETGKFIKSVNPTLDEHGMPIYYQKSDETYVKGYDKYDRDGDYLGYSYTDSLDNENLNAYEVKDHDNLYNGDEDNPFDQSTHYQYSESQDVVITVDVDGNYIVNGAETIPIPQRDGYTFAGWLIEPNALNEGSQANARWVRTGSISSAEQEQWYSTRGATGTTKTITVTFNANNGLFIDGSGDIHSSDNKLYRRQGDAYLIENTWITGEEAPNDPFYGVVVNTINETDNTANDVYSTTETGGMADMLKRVAAGNYIMEEVESPDGYVKGLPVGITVNESTEVQTAEMIDTTIKIQIVKIDATDDYTYNIYENGVLSQTPAGENITYTEPSGSFRYENVKGATLSLKAVDDNTKEIFSNWVQATNHPDITKQQEDGYWYITFQSDKPIYFEGIPKGRYVLSEIVTPDGYVKADDQIIEINETTELVTYFMNDDHTKVEIEKYYNDGNGDLTMPNQYSAGLQLKDNNGNVIAEWYTDDATDYTSTVTVDNENASFIERLFRSTITSGFTHNFEQALNEGNTDINEIQWIVERTATKRVETDTTETWLISDGSTVIIENGVIPDTAPEGFEDAYNHRNLDSEADKFIYQITMSATKTEGDSLYRQIWTTNEGNKILITAYKDNTVSGGSQSWKVEYKFNYKDDYTGIYENMVSYDTVDGNHRFDYIPEGTYIIHEFDVPDGFIAADDKTIVISETEDLQYFDLENVRKELVIAKVAQDSNAQFFAGSLNGEVLTSEEMGKIIKGAELSLYKVDAFSDELKNEFINGTIPEEATLIEQWISGNDGEYTRQDEQKEIIPDGYEVGDLKPHTITDIENGYYYLVETETPDYLRIAEPLEITVSDTTTASNLTKITVIDKEMTGKIRVHKVNADGSDLTGATFLVRNKTLGTEVGTLTTVNGYGELIISDIGTFDTEGNLIPYDFTIQETSPPAGYAVNNEIHEFTFDPNGHTDSAIAINPNDSAINNGTLTLVNDESAITISKADFDDNSNVPGVTLRVSEAEFDGEKWISNGFTMDGWEWTTTTTTSSHVMNGLTAGKTYVLEEIEAPAGYNLADDIFFRISEDGNRIDKIWYDETENPYIEFNSDNTGSIESIEFTTRGLSRTGSYVELTDTTTGSNPITIGAPSDGMLYLTSAEVTDGHIYRIREIIRYSDGSEEVIGTTTLVAELNNNTMTIPIRYGLDMEVKITDHNGNDVAIVESDGSVKTIDNSLVIDTQGIDVMSGGNGDHHEAITVENGIVTYEIHVDNAGSEITLTPDSQTEVLRTNPEVTPENGLYKWTTTEDNQVIQFVTNLRENATGYISHRVTIDGKTYTYVNPIAAPNDNMVMLNTSKLSVFNEVIGTNPDNETYEFDYQITLTKDDGTPLDGGYDYYTKDGIYHQFDAFGNQKVLNVTLKGDDFVIINGLPAGTQYSVRVVDPSPDGFSTQNTKPDGETARNNVSNVLFNQTRNLGEDRELFKKNSSYTLTEITNLNDETELETAKYAFSIGENCEVVSFTMLDKETKLEIQKIGENGNHVIGALLAIMDGNNQVEQWVSDGTSHTIEAKLESGKEYTLREIRPAPGYAFADDIPFTVSEDGTIDMVQMKDYYTNVLIIKTDEEGNRVNGAVLQILDKDKKPVKASITADGFTAGEDLIFTTSVNGTPITGQLSADTTYYIRELESPTGYYVASEDVEFVLNHDETWKVVTFQNDTIQYEFSKKDFTTGEEIPGATITIKDEEGNIIDRWISEETPHMISGKLLEAGKTYKLIEESAPDGYHYTVEVEFTVPEHYDGTGIKKVEMVDEKTEIPFTKSDITTGEELPGAHIQIKDKDGNIIDEWTSTEEEHIITGELNAGETYIMHEEGAPDGYYYSEDIEFTVPEYKDDVEKVEMKDAPTIIRIQKIDSETGEPVVGARLQILDSEGNVVYNFVSDGNPKVITGVLKAESTYTLREIAAPDGYHFTEDVQFNVPKYDNGIINVAMEDTQTNISISKTDITTGEEVPGAYLELRDENGDLIDSWVSTEQPHIIKGKLIAGETYYLYEVGAPDGYYYTEMVEFTVPRENEGIVKVEMEDKKTEVHISKTDITTSEELPGAHIQIIDKNGNIIEEWTSTEEEHIITGELNAGETYIMHEEGAPDGYSYSVDIEFTVSENGPIDRVEMKDEPTHVEFTKTDFAGEEIPGAECELKVVEDDGTITVIDSWVSGETPHVIEGVLTPGKTYYYHEAGAPDGFTYCEDIEFTLDKDGNVIDAHYVNEDGDTLLYDKDGYVTDIVVKPDGTYELDGEIVTINEDGDAVNEEGVVIAEGVKEQIEVIDNVIQMKDGPTEVIFKKTDATTTEELPGAHIQILDEFGNVVEEWTSTTEEHVVTGILIVDKIYHMHEEGAPDGYGYATDITFKVDRDNVVWVYNEETNEWETAEDSTVEMIDEVLKFEVMKVEEDTSKMLDGAVLQITDSTGTVLETWTTEANEKKTFIGEFSNGTKIKADEVYTLTEITAPEGYLKAPSQTFTVDRYGKLITITMEDTRVGKPWTTPDIDIPTITFTKYSGNNVNDGSTTITNSHRLAGAEYTIYRSDGTVYDVVTTGKDGTATIDRPPAGTYFFRETKAPDGYMLNTNVYSFTVSSGGTVNGTLDIVNYRKPEVIISKKDSETKELLPGATFRIADSEGNIVYEGTTESTGTLVFEPDYPDTFTVIEVKAPDGYQLNHTYIRFTVSENGSVSGTTEMLNNKEESKKGTISAYYDSDFYGKGNGDRVNEGLGIDKNGNVVANMPKSGDTFNIVLLAIIWIGSITGIGYFVYRRKKYQKKN